MNEFTIICNILLFLAGYKLFGNWEVPIKLGFDPFKVVGGFPTVIDSFFEEILVKNSNFPRENDLPSVIADRKFTRNLNWSCPILESETQCFSILTSSECRGVSQFSYTFWQRNLELIECSHIIKGAVECEIPFQSGNVCENVVVGIQKNEHFTIFELDDVMINTQIVQNFDKNPIETPRISIKNDTDENWDYCQNYTAREMVLAGGKNETEIFQLVPFGINSTQIAGRNNSNCSPPFPADIFLCNCKNSPSCQVPILYPTSNSTFCGATHVFIFHWHGFIHSAFVTSSGEGTAPSSYESLSVSFINQLPVKAKSKFAAKRGRFHCPSERTCFLEIFYPFKSLNSLDLPYQIGIFVFSAVVGILIVNTNRK